MLNLINVQTILMAIKEYVNRVTMNIVKCSLTMAAKKFVLNAKLKNYVLNFIDSLEISPVVVKHVIIT